MSPVTLQKDVIVLIGFAEALSAPEVLWSLVDSGFTVKAFSRRGKGSSLRFSRFVTVDDVTAPEKDASQTIADIAKLIDGCSSQFKKVLLFPLDDAAVWVCDQFQSRSDVVIAGPTGKTAAVALDKRIQIELARAAGFNVPPTAVVNRAGEILDRDQTFPLILKPAEAIRSEAGRLRKGRNWICANRAELESAVSSWAEKMPLLIQPYVAGVGEGIFGFATNEFVGAWSAHRRLRMMNPHGSGSSACISQIPSADLVNAAEKFIRSSQWTGLFMIEMLRDQGGKAWFMEFNGRPWGSIALARRQGFEYPGWNALQALDSTWKLDLRSAASSEIVCRNVGRELMHPLFVLKGPKSDAITHWPGFWRSLLDVTRFGRNHYFYNWRRNDASVFMADAFYTLKANLLKRRNGT